jgi:predicted DCC family thiol-disulfide oxidoreductase YuxK
MSAIIVFDGLCNFCNGWARFVLKRDLQDRYKFAAAQSSAGRRILNICSLPVDNLETIVLYDGTNYYVKSDAVIRILSGLRGFWALTSVALIIPNNIRNLCYDAFARRRYKLFGMAASCPFPDCSWQNKLLN